ncbi:MAG: chemotaxis protein CheB [Methylovulum sp.]|nr:chemotaxis protein CheB [Methylovulum sp.]
MNAIGTKANDQQAPAKATRTVLPVVGIGASAGGLEALEAFFSNVAANTGFAFIVVTHQQPDHVSLLPELLKHYTDMPVSSVKDGMTLLANHVFVCPPGKNITLNQCKLHLVEPEKFNAANLPIDFFLRSLAEDFQALSVGIILSGTGTDGSLGLKAIKGASGLTMAQAPKTAKFDGMPTSAIGLGDVDFVLPPEKMGLHLVQYSKGPFFDNFHTLAIESLIAPEPIQKIFILLRNRTGNDFSAYKQTTIKRRIARRMNIHQLKNPDDYVQFLQENPVEIDKLFKELLINVTNFFRDAEAFSALSEKALPKLFAGKPDNYEFRVWVTGCSSGEEAYSLAILFKEAIEKTGQRYSFQIFATDLDESSVNRARDGLYPVGIAADVSTSRLERFFKLDDNQYRINKDIRERVIFAIQNLIQDPPFTRIDLISCRNLLIYLNPELQKEILPQFHYVLNRDGILFLGSSESTGQFEEQFLALDKKWKIYQRKMGTASFPLTKLNLLPVVANNPTARPFNSLNREFQTGNIARQIEHLLLVRFAPVSVIINEHGKIFYIHGRTGKYLEPAQGQPNWNIIEMAREGLRLPLVAALSKATKTHEKEIIHKGLRVKTNGDFETIDMTLSKIFEPEPLKNLFLVSFQPQQAKDISPSSTPPPAKTLTEREKNQEKEQLEQELYFTKESLRATIEELQTSKEEMQSLNEELNTVNSELQYKVDKLSDINDDMQNLMNSTDIATLFLDTQLHIKRFTRQAQNIFKLIDSDIGRPLGDLVPILKYAHLMADAETVLQTLAYKDVEVQSLQGDWYLLRILPCRTTENMIDGLVISFIDINRIKKAEQSARAAEITTTIVNTIHQPLLVLDEQLHILTGNPAYNQAFNRGNETLAGQSLFNISGSAWNSEQLRQHLAQTFASTTAFDAFYYAAEFPDIGKKELVINGRMLKQSPSSPALILLAIDDAHGRTNQ